MAFIMHSLSWLASDGAAAIVCFPGIMYRGGAKQKIRKYLIDNNYLDAVRVTPAVYHVEKAEAKRLIRSGVEVPGVTVSRTNRCSLK